MVPAVQIAQRAFHDGANDITTQLYKHPTDFTLFQIAEWDDDTGTYRNLDQHINHGLAAQYREVDHAKVAPE